MTNLLALSIVALIALAILISPPPLLRRLLVSDPKRPRDGPRDSNALALASDVELFASCVTAGLTPSAASAAVANAGVDLPTRPHWDTVSALLNIGMPAERAWQEMAGIPGLGELAGVARVSHRSGAAMAQACERIASGLRTEAANEATSRAERAGVLIALPLSFCFLPAFLLLGLAPVVVSLGGQLIP